MSFGSAKIIATPSVCKRTRTLNTKELDVELRAAEIRSGENEYKYTYDYGFRQIGDPLIDYRRESKSYTSPQNVELVVLCRAEEGQSLSHAKIKIDISSEDHEAHIICGGIGKDFIRILIKARNTYWLKYEVRMYSRSQGAIVHLEEN